MTSTLWIALIAIALVFFIICIIVRKKRSAVSSDEPINANCAQLYVGNLSYSLRDYQLKKVFSEFGEVASVRIINHPQSRRSKGFGFVTFESPASVKKALKMHGKDLNGRSLVVRVANPRQS